MKVSISTLLALTLLVAISFAALRVWRQCAFSGLELRLYKMQDKLTVSRAVQQSAEIEIYEQALAAESPTSLLDQARERHDALPSRSILSQPVQ